MKTSSGSSRQQGAGGRRWSLLLLTVSLFLVAMYRSPPSSSLTAAEEFAKGHVLVVKPSLTEEDGRSEVARDFDVGRGNKNGHVAGIRDQDDIDDVKQEEDDGDDDGGQNTVDAVEGGSQEAKVLTSRDEEVVAKDHVKDNELLRTDDRDTNEDVSDDDDADDNDDDDGGGSEDNSSMSEQMPPTKGLTRMSLKGVEFIDDWRPVLFNFTRKQRELIWTAFGTDDGPLDPKTNCSVKGRNIIATRSFPLGGLGSNLLQLCNQIIYAGFNNLSETLVWVPLTEYDRKRGITKHAFQTFLETQFTFTATEHVTCDMYESVCAFEKRRCVYGWWSDPKLQEPGKSLQ